LYGPNASRLHDEIVPVTSRWSDPEIRKEKLRPYAEDTEAKTLDLLEEAFSQARERRIAPEVQDRLARSAAPDVAELLPALEQRGETLARRATELLASRGEKEASEMAAIIESQRTRILATAKRYDERQQRLVFDEEDEATRRQRDAERKGWNKRLGEIGKELTSEPERIRDTYIVKATRIQPVGLVYLWPISG
jgi:hypothetical protein